MKQLRSLDRFVSRIETGLMATMLAVIVGVNLLQVGMRVVQSIIRSLDLDIVFSMPSWPADLNRLLVLWIALVGGSLATQTNEHIKVDFLSRLLKGPAKFLVNAAGCLVGITVSFMLAYHSIAFLKMEYELKETMLSGRVPLWIIQLIIPIGFLVIGFRFFLNFFGAPERPEKAGPLGRTIEDDTVSCDGP